MNSDILIISYSYTGNTHHIAAAIKELTGGDWCEIYPCQPYPTEFQKRLVQVRKEVDTGFLPALLPGITHPNNYSTVFIGSPNWCGTIAPPVAAYLSKHSFSGKVVMPFFSHCGGGGGNGKLEQDLKHFCKGADIKSGFSAINDGSQRLSKNLFEWISENKILSK